MVGVVRVGAAWGHAFDVLPVETERCRPVVVVGVRPGLSGEVPVDTGGAPAAVEGVTDTVGSVVNAVVVAVPLWDATFATLVGANVADALVGVVRAVWVVSRVTGADVPGVAVVVGQLHAVAVGDEVVLARPVVVVRVGVTTGVDRVRAHLEVVAVPDEGREVDVVRLPSRAHASERWGPVDGGEAHATLHVHTDGVVGRGKAVNLRRSVLRHDAHSAVLHHDVVDRGSGSFDPKRRTGVRGVDDRGVADADAAAVDLDRGHVVVGGLCAVDFSGLGEHQCTVGANVERRHGGGVLVEVLQDTTGDRKRAVSDVQSDAVGRTGGLDGPLAARVGRDVHDERTAVADGEHRTVGRGGGHGHHGSHHDEGAAVDVKVSGQRHWEAVEEVDTRAGLCALEGLVVRHPGAVHVGLVKVDRSGLQEQLNLVAEAKASGGVPRRGHFGLVLTGCTPSEDVVIAVGVAVGVTGDDPCFGHARGVGLGDANLEQRSSGAGRGVHHGGSNAVARLVHLRDDAVDQGLTVEGHLSEATVPNGRGGRDVHRTAGGVATGVCTIGGTRTVIVADVDQDNVAVRRSLGEVVAAAVNVAGGHFNRGQRDVRVAPIDGIHRGVVVVDARTHLHHDGVGGRGREAVQTANVCVLEDEAPGTAVDGQVTDVQVLPCLGLGVRRGAGNRHVACTDVLKDAEVDALHRDVAGIDVHHDRVIAHWSNGGRAPAVGGDPQVSAAEVDVVNVHAGHGVEAAVGVIRHADVVEVNVGVAAVHGVDGHTGLAGRVADAHVGNGHVLQINIDEVHVGIRDGDVLDKEAASGGTWVVDDRATPSLSVGVAVLHGTFRQDGDGVLSEVETRIVRAVHGEVRHLDDRPLTRAVLEGRSDVREGHVVHGEVTHVGVGAGGAAVAAARGNRGVAGVAEVDVRELVSVVSAGRTRGGERHALPLGASLALEGNRVGRVAVDLHLVARAVKGNSLTVGHLNHDAGLNGEVSGDGQVVVARVDADWAVVDVPRGVRGDVGVNVRTLAVVWHGAVANAAVNRRVVVAVVGGVVAPPWRNRAGARRRVARVRHAREVAAPRRDAALKARRSVVDEVHVTLTTQANAVVGVGALVEGAEVLELEVIRHVDVRVAAGLVGVPVPAVRAVVAVRGTAAAAADRRVVVLDLGQAWREGLVAVARRGGVHAVVGGERVGAVEPAVPLLQGLTLGAGLVLVSRDGVVDVDLTAGVVLELKLVGHVVEDNLVGAQVGVGVPHVVPLNDEHLVRVADFERGSRGLNGVRRGHVG